jgi:hypothetical protein
MVASMNYGFFWFYAAFLSISVVFTYFFIPETSGVSLERMEELFGGHSPATVDASARSDIDSNSQDEEDFNSEKQVERRV